MKVQISSALKGVSASAVVVAGQVKQISRFAYYNGAIVKNLKVFTTPIQASPSPALFSVSSERPGTLTTSQTTVTVAGGRAPFTYSWARTAGAVGAADFPSSAVTSFSASLGYGADESATFTCTVIDALGATTTAQVDVQFYVSPPGGGFLEN